MLLGCTDSESSLCVCAKQCIKGFYFHQSPIIRCSRICPLNLCVYPVWTRMGTSCCSWQMSWSIQRQCWSWSSSGCEESRGLLVTYRKGQVRNQEMDASTGSKRHVNSNELSHVSKQSIGQKQNNQQRIRHRDQFLYEQSNLWVDKKFKLRSQSKIHEYRNESQSFFWT